MMVRYEKKDSVIISKLINNAPIQIIPINNSKSSVIAVGFKAGAFYEEGFGAGSNDGISHFLEHMFFKSTKNMTTQEIKDSFTKIGAELNAFTSSYLTTYYAKVPSRNITRAIELWGDMINNFTIDEDEFEREKKVVLQEVKIFRAHLQYYALKKALSNLYKGTQLAHDVIGTEESLSGITPEMMNNYRKINYAPENSIILITGNVNFEEVYKDVDECFSSKNLNFQSDKRINPWKDITSSWKGNHTFIKERRDSPLAYIALNWEVRNKSKKDEFLFSLVNVLIDYKSKNSIVHKEIISKGICSTLRFGTLVYPPISTAQIMYSTHPAKIEEIYNAIVNKIIRKVMNLEITDELLNRLKQEYIGKRTMYIEELTNLAFNQIFNVVNHGIGISPEEFERKIHEVTKEEIKETIQRMFDNWECAVFATGNIPQDWEPKQTLD
ncbi:MAG: M16 family metallopeptidase [Candidatus Heimdallarchaeaceae archaeon]